MREFRPKPFRTTKPVRSGGRESSDLTEEQEKAMKAEFDRRVMTFQEKWHLCPNRLCRRKRECLGPPLACLRQSWIPPWTNNEYRRLRRDVVRNPPRVQAT